MSNVKKAGAPKRPQAKKKKKFEDRDVKCISDHYAIQSFIKLK